MCSPRMRSEERIQSASGSSSSPWAPAPSSASWATSGTGGSSDDQSPIRDQLYYPLAQVPDRLMRMFSSVMSFAVKTDVPPMTVIDPLRRSLRGHGGDQILYEVRTMEQLASSSLDRQRFLMLLFGAFAGLALLLACIGLYGVLAYLTGQRVQEIGVRMALGATAGDVIWMVLHQGFGMV